MDVLVHSFLEADNPDVFDSSAVSDNDVVEAIERGQTLTAACGKTGLFPDLFKAVETGQIKSEDVHECPACVRAAF